MLRLLLVTLATACSSSPGSPDAGADLATRAAEWRSRHPLPAPRQETAVVELGGLIYVIGGFDRDQAVVATVERYDPASDDWTAVAPLPRTLHHANAAVVDGKIYLVGALAVIGGNLFAAIGDIYEYDPGANAWTSRGSMPAGEERGGSLVASLDGEVFVAGGLRGAAVSDFSSWSPASGQTTSRSPMPAPRDHGVGCAVGGRFFAIGGRNTGITAHTDRVDEYDPARDAWTSVAPMPTSRGGAAGAVVEGKIVVAGGEGNGGSPSGVFAAVELYDPLADRWQLLPPMPTPRHGTGAAAIGNRLYVPGGASMQAFGAVATVEVLQVP